MPALRSHDADLAFVGLLRRRRPAIDVLAAAASTPYRTMLPAQVLQTALLTGVVPAEWESHVRMALDEVPVSLLLRVLFQIRANEAETAAVWGGIADLAVRLGCRRNLRAVIVP